MRTVLLGDNDVSEKRDFFSRQDKRKNFVSKKCPSNTFALMQMSEKSNLQVLHNTII